MNRQSVERDGDALFILQLPSDLQARLNERVRRSVVSLLACQDTGGKKRSRSRFGWCRRSSKLEKSPQPVPALSEMLPHLPEPKKGQAQTQTPLRIFAFYQPLERRAKIVMFDLEAIQQFRSLGISVFGSSLFCQHEAVGGMRAPCRRLFPACSQFFQSVLTNRFQHHEARFPFRLVDLPNEALVHH